MEAGALAILVGLSRIQPPLRCQPKYRRLYYWYSLLAHVDKYLDMLIFLVDEPAMVSLCAIWTPQPKLSQGKASMDDSFEGNLRSVAIFNNAIHLNFACNHFHWLQLPFTKSFYDSCVVFLQVSQD